MCLVKNCLLRDDTELIWVNDSFSGKHKDANGTLMADNNSLERKLIAIRKRHTQ